MKNFYRLLNVEFGTMLKGTLLLCIGTALIPLLFLYLEVRNYDPFTTVYERFEIIYASSGSAALFLVFLAALYGVFLKTIYAQYWRSKSIYTYLTLPVKREVLYFSKLTAFLVCLLMLLTAQLLSVILGYNLVAEQVGSIQDGQFLMNNGLFLAFIRSEFLRILFPIGFPEMVSSLSIGFALSTGIYYGALCERSKQYGGLVLVMIGFFIIRSVVNERMSVPLHAESYTNWYFTSTLLLLLSGFFMWHSIRLFKRGAIA